MNKWKVMIVSGFLACGAAQATSGTPYFMAVANTPEFPANVAILEEIQFESFGYAADCSTDFQKMPLHYTGSLKMRVGSQLYSVMAEGLPAYGNFVSFADVAACEARDVTKVESLTLVFENTLLPLYQQVWTWTPKTGVVTFGTPLVGGLTTSAGVVLTKH